MNRRCTRFGMGILLAAWAIPIGPARSADPAAIAFKTTPGRVEIFVGGEPLGTRSAGPGARIIGNGVARRCVPP